MYKARGSLSITEMRKLVFTRILLGSRVEQEELLDSGKGTDQDVIENLAEMQRINDFFGGTRALTRHLFPALLQWDQPQTVLDLGTGGAGLPVKLVRWAHQTHRPILVFALDWSMRNLKSASNHSVEIREIHRIQANALHLPFKPGDIDYVISSLFLHHLSPDKLVALLRSSYQQSRHGLIMSDLVRGWIPLAAFKLIQPVFARNFLTRLDGEISIRRAYTPAELACLAQEAGLPKPRIYTHWPWRMTLVVEK